MLKLTFLGTGTSQGIPIIGDNSHPVFNSTDSRDKRLRSSVMLSWDNQNILIDCGPDFRQQMLATQFKTVNGILFTHEHADHTTGLDDIRPFFFKQGNIPAYATKRVLKALKKRFYYMFQKRNKYPNTASFDTFAIKPFKKFTIGGKEILPIEAMHGSLPIIGFKVDNFAYFTDVKTLSKKAISQVQNIDVLVINALQIKPHDKHLNLEEALRIIEKINPKKSYFTHISHNLGFHEEVQKKLPKNVFLGYDFLEIEI